MSDAEQGRALRSGTDGPRSRREDHRSLRPGRPPARSRPPARRRGRGPHRARPARARRRPDRLAGVATVAPRPHPDRHRRRRVHRARRSRRRQDADARGDPRRPLRRPHAADRPDHRAGRRVGLVPLPPRRHRAAGRAALDDHVFRRRGQGHVRPLARRCRTSPISLPAAATRSWGATCWRGSTAMSSPRCRAAPDCVRSTRSPTSSATPSPTWPRPRARASS